MGRKKLLRLEKVKTLANVFDERSEDTEKQIRNYFGNDNPIALEIGCGQGDYSIEMAQLYPDKNFIGVDYKGARIFMGATKANELKLRNVAFLLTGAEKLQQIFVKEKINEIFIPFPDPYKSRKSFKRLIDENFLNIYKAISSGSLKVHLKTDNEEVFNYAINVAKEGNYKIQYVSSDLYSESGIKDHQEIKTKYERQYLNEGKEIKYICFEI